MLFFLEQMHFLYFFNETSITCFLAVCRSTLYVLKVCQRANVA